jgi:hypothetical protein
MEREHCVRDVGRHRVGPQDAGFPEHADPVGAARHDPCDQIVGRLALQHQVAAVIERHALEHAPGPPSRVSKGVRRTMRSRSAATKG